MSHLCVHFHYKRDLLKKAAGFLKRKSGLIPPLSWPVFAGKAVFNERNIHGFEKMLALGIPAIEFATPDEDRMQKLQKLIMQQGLEIVSFK